MGIYGVLLIEDMWLADMAISSHPLERHWHQKLQSILLQLEKSCCDNLRQTQLRTTTSLADAAEVIHVQLL